MPARRASPVARTTVARTTARRSNKTASASAERIATRARATPRAARRAKTPRTDRSAHRFATKPIDGAPNGFVERPCRQPELALGFRVGEERVLHRVACVFVRDERLFFRDV